MRHKILIALSAHLNDNRDKQPSERAINHKQIANKTGFSVKDINEQMDYFFDEKELVATSYDIESKPIYHIRASGLKAIAERKFINEGKLLNTNIWTGYITAVFTTIAALVGVIALTIEFTQMSHIKSRIDKLESENNNILFQIKKLESMQLKLGQHDQIQNNHVDTSAKNQTNLQKH